MKQLPALKNYQQPVLSENQMLIKPVDAVVCPEAVYLLQQIRHPALPALRGVENIALGDQAPQPCFLFDFLPGTSLDRLSDEERAEWPMTAQLHYFAELSRVLDFLHKQADHGLMHLDIKPANLLLGPGLRPYLIDFDAMRFAENSGSAEKRQWPGKQETPALGTKTGDSSSTPGRAIACTPNYAAPELLQGRPCPASDTYALGLTLLHILTGFEPQPGYQDKVPHYLQKLPPDVAAIINRCLMTLPELRFPDAGELSRQLERVAERLKSAETGEDFPDEAEAVVAEWEEWVSGQSAAGCQVAAGSINVASSQYSAASKPESPDGPAKESPDVPVKESPDGPVKEPPTSPPPEKLRDAEDLPQDLARLICVWDGAEFGCELAVQLRKYYSRILVIDGDLIGPQADLLLGKRPRKGQQLPIASFDNFNLAMAEIERGTLTSSRLKDLVWPSLADQVDLLVFGANLDEYDHIPPESLLYLLDVARLSYPVIVLLCSRFIYDAFTCLGLMTADQVLIPLAANAAAFRTFNRSIDFLALRRQLDPERIRFIAFPYDERNDLSLGTLDVLSGNRLIGSVQTCFARQRQRGSAKPYACSVSSVNEKEYDGIIARLNHLVRKEHPDADHHVTRPFRRTIRFLSRQTAAAQ